MMFARFRQHLTRSYGAFSSHVNKVYTLFTTRLQTGEPENLHGQRPPECTQQQL